MIIDEHDDLERRAFRDWDPKSLGDIRRAIERRHSDL